MPRSASNKRTRSSNSLTTPRKRLKSLPMLPPTPEPSQSWERQLLESQHQSDDTAPTTAPTDSGSLAGTDGSASIATTEAVDDYINNGGDNFNGLDWARVGSIKPLRQLSRTKSWIYQHGYRLMHMDQISKSFWLCKYCHIHKLPQVLIDVTQATTSAATHLGLPIKGHNLSRAGVKTSQGKKILPSTQLSLRQALVGGFAMSQSTANAMSSFSVQSFRHAFVLWLLDNNLPMEIISRSSTRELFYLISAEAEGALWRSPRSVATYAMRLFHLMQPQVVKALSESVSKIHISFDGWTTKGGTRGFFGIVAHFATPSGTIQDLPIDLPQLTGAHTGDAIAAAVVATLQAYKITSSTLGYFVLDNASNNDTAIAAVAREFDSDNFNAAHRRLRCAPHTINLIGQALLFGKDKDAYNNAQEKVGEEEDFMQEWRKYGALGTLLAVITYIRTPQQHQLFTDCLRTVNESLPANAAPLKILRPIKPVVTRWNSYYDAIERATYLHAGFDLYMEKHISRVAYEERRGTKSDVPAWMRSGGLQSADWAINTEYQRCLEPLKTTTKRLEGRGNQHGSSFGAIHEVLPVFEFLLDQLEKLAAPYADVDFSAHAEAPEDHLYINLRAAWAKDNEYYNKLDDSPVYYAATCLHPYYKYYCENAWEHKPEWLRRANNNFQALWESYKKPPPTPPSQPPRTGAIDDVIASFTARRNTVRDDSNEYNKWRDQEPEWS